MTKPIRATLIFAFLSGLCAIPLTYFPAPFYGWSPTLKYYILINLLLYSGLLCYCSRTSLVSIFYPSLLAAGMALWANSYFGFTVLSLGVLGWTRSGICFKEVSLRGIFAEIITLGGGAGSLLLWRAGPASGLPLALWLFFLVQTLYFYVVPGRVGTPGPPVSDPFELASCEIKRILTSLDV